MPLSFTIYGHAHVELACQNVFNTQTPIVVTARWESKYVAEMWRGQMQAGLANSRPLLLDLSRLYPNN